MSKNEQSRAERQAPPADEAMMDEVHAAVDAAAASASAAGAPHADAAEHLQLREAQEKALRTQAELENFRKRVRRERDEERKYALLPLVRDVLPVIDNLERAMAAVEGNQLAGGMLEGVKMVAQQLVDVLSQHDCVAIESLGHPFDPMSHEAVGQQPSDEYPKGTVAAVVQTGYRLHDRVIRPSHVIVSQGRAG